MIEMNPTQIAEYAAQAGPDASDRPAYDSSPDGLAFQVGLWAREKGIAVHEVKASRGYTYILNRDFRINLKNDVPIVSRI